MSIQTFATKAAARAMVQTMAGWATTISPRVYADGTRYYVIRCNSAKHLCTDGYVR